jgi:predicted component of type VI protein secretion system
VDVRIFIPTQTVSPLGEWSDFSPCFTLRAAFAALLFVKLAQEVNETVEINPFLRIALRISAKTTILNPIRTRQAQPFMLCWRYLNKSDAWNRDYFDV